MRLPITPSHLSSQDLDDNALDVHLLHAGANSECNRIQCIDFDDFRDGQVTPKPIGRSQLRSIKFHPEVSIRFIRARSNTIRSSISDNSSSHWSSSSPMPPDTKLLLREYSPVSDDEEFDRFYNAPESGFAFPSCLDPRLRSLSFDYLDEPRLIGLSSRRRRSFSCDELF